MSLLLDTHVFLWWNTEPEKLSKRAYDAIENGEREIYFSAASAWEIAIKYAKGLLELPDNAESFVLTRVRSRGFRPMPVEISHALHTYHLPMHHQDPFDRLLVSQAQLESLAIVTADPSIARYDVEIVW